MCSQGFNFFRFFNGINECLPETQSELLHVELLKWYEDHGRFFESNDLSQVIYLSYSVLKNVSWYFKYSIWMCTLVRKVAYFLCMEDHVWSHDPQEQLIFYCYQEVSNCILHFVSHPDFPSMEPTWFSY